MTLTKLFAAVVFPVLQVVAVAEPAHSQTPKLNLGVARDIAGSFLGTQAMYVDAKHIFLASAQGNLLVLQNTSLGRNPYPLMATIPVSTFPLRSITGDGSKLYITAADQYLYVYNEATSAFIKKVFYPVPLTSVAVDGGPGGYITLGEWQANVAVDNRYVYLAPLSPNDVAEVDSKLTYAFEETLGNNFAPGVTNVFDRASNTLVANLPNPINNQGSTTSAVALFTDGVIMAQMTPGCCGTGVTLYDAATSEHSYLSTISEPYVDCVVTMNNDTLLVAGTELGTVVLYNITNPRAPVRLSSIDLRAATGHTGSEDIEIRSIATGPGGFIFGASSWGNGTSSSPTLPSFFVLDVASKVK